MKDKNNRKKENELTTPLNKAAQRLSDINRLRLKKELQKNEEELEESKEKLACI